MANPLLRGLALALWAVVLLQSSVDGRLDLLLRAALHPLVSAAGGVLLVLALLQVLAGLRGESGGRRDGRLSLATAAIALLLILWPPNPSFADLASQRPGDDTASESLSFVLPPAQRTGSPTGVASARQQRTSSRAICGGWPGTGSRKPLMRTGSPSNSWGSGWLRKSRTQSVRLRWAGGSTKLRLSLAVSSPGRWLARSAKEGLGGHRISSRAIAAVARLRRPSRRPPLSPPLSPRSP
ncbi:MAG: hypothetical protein ACKOPS_22135, partial [Cyanobium sp.]